MPLIRPKTDASAAAESLDLEAAMAGLASGDADLRWRAARTLAGFPAMAGALGEAAAREPDARVREAMFTSLARIGSEAAVAALLAHMRADDSGHRTGAMDALKSMPSALAPAVARLLHDPDPDVRILACELARELPAAEAAAALGPVLEPDAELNVCAAAVEVIAECGSPADLIALDRCGARFADPFLAFAIRAASDRLAGRATRG